MSDSSVSIGGGGADRYPYPVWAGLGLHPYSRRRGMTTPQLPQIVAVRKHRSFLTHHLTLNLYVDSIYIYVNCFFVISFNVISFNCYFFLMI